ncbi:DUF4231 domain-containing protein [Mycoplasmopsis lipofaciens]|uniref:DUF4231 domain-containing protein n=1 Tax=Mycoplasmopsis lipofaciens TaxID=114884 RepID=UPI000481F97C|nr:DUF4231 domain-containing protein [Mycoplasmopsis lipofaciens]
MVTNPLDFIKTLENKMKRIVYVYSFWYFTLNILLLMVSLTISILSSIQVFHNFKAFGEWNRYLLVTTGISALTTFLASLISFFYLSQIIEKYKGRLQKIELEKLLWEESLGIYKSKNKNIEYFKKICEICNLKWEAKNEQGK